MLKFFKKILFACITLVVIVLIVALFIDTKFEVTKEVSVDRSRSEVFNYAKFLKNQETYGVWSKRDTTMKKEYLGVDGNVGCTYKWDSKEENVGKGQQKILEIKDLEKIVFELKFERPWESTSEAQMNFEQTSDSVTKVLWSVSGEMPYPWNFMTLFMDMEKELGSDLQSGLDNMKSILENQ